MEVSPKTRIDSFLKQEHIALAGYSRNPKKFGHVVYKTLKGKGYVIHPVNPGGGTAPGGETVHSTLETLPNEVKALLIMTRPPVTTRLVEQALEQGIRHLWIQQMSGSKEAKEMLEQCNPGGVVYNSCILLHASPTGIHKFHRNILRLFGRLPRSTA